MVLVPKTPSEKKTPVRKPIISADAPTVTAAVLEPVRPTTAPVDRAIKSLRLWQETASYGAIALVTALGASALTFTWYASNAAYNRYDFRHDRIDDLRQEEAPEVVEGDPAARRAIDGLPVSLDAVEPDYFAVMIDNIAEAHPESGVAKAALVIEAPVEGGITRLMAVYPADTVVERIGPVRSARPYYARWALEYGALYAHVGGSNEALDVIKSIGVRDLNEFYNASSFWRDAKRAAPHNVYTSTERLAAAAAKRGEPRPLDPWRYKLDATLDERGDGVLVLEIKDYGQAGVAWVYERDLNAYRRVIAGEDDKDADGAPVLAKNVVVQFAPVAILDEVGRRRIQTEAGGEALVALDGRVIGGRWKKEPDGGRTRFYDAADNEIAFNAGTTWIEVVPTDTEVTY
jgi:hypothetical protein